MIHGQARLRNSYSNERSRKTQTHALVMSWSFQLSAEERHLAKISDLAALDQIALGAGDEYEVSAAYERLFEALDCRTNTDDETVFDWGQRYLTWANRFTERDRLFG